MIQEISYEQAIAYYQWKYHLTSNPTKKMSAVYYESIPSKEQFEKVQSGQQVFIEAQSKPYPDPLFRCVIHVYSK